ncbi:MAG: hypothetical protein WCZ90_15735 [Melioribacteraceae bacterium]
MKTFQFLAIVTLTILPTLSCSEGVTDSRERIIRAPQDMIWTADTLKGFDQYAQLLPRNLLVFSANDAWLTCWSDIARGLIWHFDGKIWNESNIAKDVGGMRIQDVNGYSSSDLWACGYTGDEIFIAHYDGSRWTKYNTNGIKGELIKMCKDADGNLWAGGRNGLIMKYDKTKWIADRIDLKKEKDINYFIKSIEATNNQIHFIISSIDLVTLDETYYYGRREAEAWKLMDSVLMRPNSRMKWGNFKLFYERELYSVGLQGAWKYSNGSWEKIAEHDGEFYEITGTSNDYLVVASAYRTLKYFNGINWLDVSNLFVKANSSFTFRAAWTNGYETFIIGEGAFGNTEKLVVWRGK